MSAKGKIPRNELSIRIASMQDLSDLYKQQSDFYIGSWLYEELPKKDRVFVAKHHGKIVGYVLISLLPENFGRVKSISVHKGYDGLGIGRKLIGAANASFIRHKIKRSVVKSIDNPRTRRFYEKHTNYRNVNWQKPLEFELHPVRNPRKKRPPH